MKRAVTAAVVVVIGTAGLTGCGSGGGTTTVIERTQAPAPQTVTETTTTVTQAKKPAPKPKPKPTTTEATTTATAATPAAPPDVKGLSLPEAKKELSAAGFRADVSNTDTTFGILVPQNYKVCKQSPPRGNVVPILAQKYGC